MPIPDYREAAHCGRCIYYGRKMSNCTKHGGKVDWLHICADFTLEEDVEKFNH